MSSQVFYSCCFKLSLSWRCVRLVRHGNQLLTFLAQHKMLLSIVALVAVQTDKLVFTRPLLSSTLFVWNASVGRISGLIWVSEYVGEHTDSWALGVDVEVLGKVASDLSDCGRQLTVIKRSFPSAVPGPVPRNDILVCYVEVVRQSFGLVQRIWSD